MKTEILETGRRYKGVDSDERNAIRRAKILEAGVELFGTRGYQATTLAMLSAQSGVPHRYMISLFADKDAILQEIHQGIIDEILAAVRAARSEVGDDDPFQIIRQGISAACAVLLSDIRKARIGCLEAAGISEAFESFRRNVLRQYFPLVLDEIEKFVAKGVLPRRDNYLAMAVGLSGAFNALMTEWVLTPPEQRPSADVLVDQICEFYRGVVLAALQPVHQF